MLVTCKELAKLIDHAVLKPTATDEDLEKGCQIAKKYNVATVCVKPCHVAKAAKLLKGTGVKVSTVIGFPHGANILEIKASEAEMAIVQGAKEIDMVMNIGAMLSHDYALVEKDIKAVVKVAKKACAIVKVILENCYLTDEMKRKACQIAEKAGADFVKTSTGFGTGGATLKDLRLMKKSVSPRMQLKASGGIRTYEEALKVIAAGCSRIGTSSTADIMEECKRRQEAGLNSKSGRFRRMKGDENG